MLFNHVVQDKPDVVLLMHAINDSGVLGGSGSYGSRMREEAGIVQILKSCLQLASIRSSVFGLFRRVVTSSFEQPSWNTVGDPGSVDVAPFATRLRVFVDMCRSFGAVPVLVTQPLVTLSENELTPSWANPSNQSIFNGSMRNVADTTGCDLIDLAEFIKGQVTDLEKVEEMFYAGMHVTDFGSTVYAEFLAKSLIPILQSPDS